MASSSPSQSSMSPPSLFSGQPNDFRKWRKRIALYNKKMVVTKREKEAVYNLLGSLTGTAWKVVEDAQIEADDTFKKILKLLDQSFQYVRS